MPRSAGGKWRIRKAALSIRRYGRPGRRHGEGKIGIGDKKWSALAFGTVKSKGGSGIVVYNMISNGNEKGVEKICAVM
jgi:hypothetical protein